MFNLNLYVTRDVTRGVITAIKKKKTDIPECYLAESTFHAAEVDAFQQSIIMPQRIILHKFVNIYKSHRQVSRFSFSRAERLAEAFRLCLF